MPALVEDRTPSHEELVDLYQKRIYAVIYRMTGRHADTDDLCQEAFLQIFRSLPRWKPGTNLDSWVYRIAMNVSVDHLRRKGMSKAARAMRRSHGIPNQARMRLLNQVPSRPGTDCGMSSFSGDSIWGSSSIVLTAQTPIGACCSFNPIGRG